MKRIAIAATIAALQVGCGNQAETSLHSTTESKAALAERSVNDFAWDLYAELSRSSKADENVFFSPVSVSAAFSMLYAGAAGSTAEELSNVLRFPRDTAATAEAFGSLLSALQASDQDQDYKLAIANKMWGQEGLDFVPSYLKTLRDVLHSDLDNLDFKNVEHSMKVINGWASDNTNGKIPRIVNQDFFQGELLMVLANAVYFKGTWETEFDKQLTEKNSFYLGTDGKNVEAEFMFRHGKNISYGEDDSVQAVHLPYRGKSIYMTVILPKEGKGLDTVEKQLSPDYLQTLIRSSYRQPVNLFLPKFKSETSYLLHENLQNMGLSLTFSNAANFSGIRSEADIKVSQAIHKAFVEVNEEGTEAAAVTVIGGVRTTSVRPEPQPKLFRADRPFIYVIRTAEGAPLFIGRLSNPVK
jgi:serpin B